MFDPLLLKERSILSVNSETNMNYYNFKKAEIHNTDIQFSNQLNKI